MKIIAAALRLKNGLVLTLARPHRHHHIISHGIRAGLMPPLPGSVDGQGFLTDTGDYVTRTEAKQLAIESGQISPDKMLSSELLSEDLW